MTETTQERFHVGRIDTRDAVTAAGGQRCRRPLLGRAGRVPTPTPVCSKQQVVEDFGCGRLRAVILPVSGLRRWHQPVDVEERLKPNLYDSLRQFGE